MEVRITFYKSERSGPFVSVRLGAGIESRAEARNAGELFAKVAEMAGSGKVPPGTWTPFVGKANQSARAFRGFDDAAHALSRRVFTVAGKAEPVSSVESAALGRCDILRDGDTFIATADGEPFAKAYGLTAEDAVSNLEAAIA